MARRAVQVEEIEELDDISPAEMESEETLSDIKEAFNAGPGDDKWIIHVYRVTGSNRQRIGEPYLFTISPQELPINERLRDEYGSGQYRARVMKNGKLYKSFTMDVEAPTRRVEEKRPETDITALISAFTQAQERTIATVREMFETRVQPIIQAPPPDPFAMMDRMVSMLANMRSLTPQPEATSGAQAMEMFSKGVEITKTLMESSGGGGDTNFMDIMKEVVRAAAPALAARMGVPLAPEGDTMQTGGYAASPVAPALAPPSQPAPVPPMAIPGQPMGEAQVRAMVKGQIDFLIGRAQAGSDPQLYAEMVLDVVPPALKQELATNTDEAIMAQLGAINPAVNSQPFLRNWFLTLIREIREYLATENAPHAPGVGPVQHPGGTAGDSGDAPDHGGVNPPLQG